MIVGDAQRQSYRVHQRLQRGPEVVVFVEQPPALESGREVDNNADRASRTTSDPASFRAKLALQALPASFRCRCFTLQCRPAVRLRLTGFQRTTNAAWVAVASIGKSNEVRWDSSGVHATGGLVFSGRWHHPPRTANGLLGPILHQCAPVPSGLTAGVGDGDAEFSVFAVEREPALAARWLGCSEDFKFDDSNGCDNGLLRLKLENEG